MPDCVFCKIASGEVESKKIYEDETAVAFLDINPAAPGHTLVIPKMHYVNILDVDELTLRRLAGAMQKVARQVAEKMKCDITILQSSGAAAGQVVFHIHFHVIPRREGDGIHLTHKRAQMSDEEFEEVQEKLRM